MSLYGWRKRIYWLTLPLLLGCAATGVSPSAAGPTAASESVLVGPIDRNGIEMALPDWVATTVEARPDPETAMALSELVTNRRVTIFFGSWCSDSRRELSRLWAAFDLVGGDVGFPVEYVAVDREKEEPAALVAGREILYVPTIIVEDNGREVGRIIETAPDVVERDLLALLEGAASGWLSARTDLPTAQDGSGG